MIIREQIGIDGKRIVEMIPENEEDERTLEQMAAAGAIDARDGFSEEPELWDDGEPDSAGE